MVVDRSSVVACVLLVGRRRAAGRGGDACACPATLSLSRSQNLVAVWRFLEAFPATKIKM
jgi:hypothetical protein